MRSKTSQAESHTRQSDPGYTGNMPAEELPVRSWAAPMPAVKPLKILIVEDDPGLLEVLSQMVYRIGHAPATVDCATDALSRMEKERFDMVLSDYIMPQMDGYQLADRIREKYFGTKVIIMTGCSGEEVAFMLEKPSIVDALLFKPFSLKTMQAMIEMICKRP